MKMETAKMKVGDLQRESPRARVLRWLEDSIKSGSLPRGAELPTEREIARIVGVATCTAALAMDEAEERGLAVRRHPGARRRYAGTLRGDSLSSSMVFVLAEVREFGDGATAPGWSDEFLAFDVVRRLSLMGRPVSFFNTKSLPRRGLDALFEAQPGGMVATSSVNGDPVALEALRRCREAGIPAVAYGNALELRDYDRAYSDHRAGSRDLTRWLLAHGRRRIVPFFPLEPSMFWETERIAGYEEAMREAGLEPLPCAVFGSPSVEAMESSVERFRVRTALAFSALAALRRDGPGPDALLCPNDDRARSAVAAIRDLGLVPNRDILVAGYDNSIRPTAEDPTASLRPAVTVDKHNERSAQDIAELLLARMEGRLPAEPQARIHAHEVIEVGRTGVSGATGDQMSRSSRMSQPASPA